MTIFDYEQLVKKLKKQLRCCRCNCKITSPTPEGTFIDGVVDGACELYLQLQVGDAPLNLGDAVVSLGGSTPADIILAFDTYYAGVATLAYNAVTDEFTATLVGVRTCDNWSLNLQLTCDR